MKTFYFSLFFLMIISKIFSQISLHSYEMLPIGSQITMKRVQNLNMIDTTIQGENVIWDFSTLTPNEYIADFIVNIINPADAPFSSQFPTSNYAYLEEPSMHYSFFQLTPSLMQRVGSYSQNDNILKKYSDPQIEYVFPLEYGAYNYDTWNSDGSTFGGIYELECIGTGTLILPNGTYEALMVRVYLEEWILVIDCYFWYDASSGTPLLQYMIGDGFFIEIFAQYTTNIKLNTEEYKYFNNISYNNPVVNELILTFNNDFNENYNLIISDLSGKIIHNKQINKYNNVDKNEIRIDLSNYNPGMYIVQLYSANGKANKSIKIVKQ